MFKLILNSQGKKIRPMNRPLPTVPRPHPKTCNTAKKEIEGPCRKLSYVDFKSRIKKILACLQCLRHTYLT